MAIISFVEYFEQYGIQCTHAFFVANPIIFSDHSQTLSKTVLFTGPDGRIFFFNKEGVIKEDSDKLSDLQLQVLLHNAPSKQGESSRDIQDNCITTTIPSHTKLAAFIGQA